LRDNPVFALGMRTRWRGFRLWWLPLIAAVANLAALCLLLLTLRFARDWAEGWLKITGMGVSASQFVWYNFYALSAGLAQYAVIIIVPALTATTMSREAEGKTLDMLAVTKLAPGAIVWGKFFSGVYPIFIGYAVTIAFGLTASACGRLPVVGVLAGYVDTLAMLFAVGLSGVAISAVTGRTVASLVLAYVCSVLIIPLIQTLVALPALVWYMSGAMQSVMQPGPFPFPTMMNPLALSASTPVLAMTGLRALASLCIAAGAWYAAVVWIRRRP
jgi:ABC-type transport system involved in multi-copper enzyme maturation permease subunit